VTPSTNLAVPERVLVVSAHPDDAEFGCAATIAKWTSGGAVATYILVTDGSRGTWKDDVHPFELALLRESEQKQACSILGVSSVQFLRYRDGEVEASSVLRRELATWIRHLRPEVVITHDPWKRYSLHPDHRAVGRSVCDAIVEARDPGYLRELAAAGLGPHRPAELLLWDADEINHIEEITDECFDAKIQALFAHQSQFESTMRFDDPRSKEALEFRDSMRSVASDHGELAGFFLGEGFRRIDPSR
jgi:LmbE family N-acetylglucosaminyl deacetylase